MNLHKLPIDGVAIQCCSKDLHVLQQGPTYNFMHYMPINTLNITLNLPFSLLPKKDHKAGLQTSLHKKIVHTEIATC